MGHPSTSAATRRPASSALAPSTEGILVESTDGEILRASATITRILSSEPGAGSTRTLDEVVVEEDAPDLAVARRAARGADGHGACTVRLREKDGGLHTCEVRTYGGVARDDALVLVVRDITAVHRLAVEAHLLRRVTELCNSGVSTPDTYAGAVDDIRRTLGWDRGRVLPGSDPGPDGNEHAAASPASHRARGTGALAVDRNSDGTMTVALPVLAHGEVTAILEFTARGGVGVDDELEALLHDVSGQLGSVADRQRTADELETHRAELARSNAELERFAYVASHDLQEPLRKIVGFAELLERHHEPADREEADYLHYLVDAARRQQTLIRDLLAFSRVGRREMAEAPVDVGALVAQVVEDLQVQIAESGASVEVEDLPTVLGDAPQLAEVFMNLVTNALKYRSDRPRIRIGAGETADPRTAEIVVEDNGIGIAPKHREEVFEIFRRLHSPTAYSGTGIGLALVHRIVTRHGGTIWITDGPDGIGTCIHVTLPTPQDPT